MRRAHHELNLSGWILCRCLWTSILSHTCDTFPFGIHIFFKRTQRAPYLHYSWDEFERMNFISLGGWENLKPIRSGRGSSKDCNFSMWSGSGKWPGSLASLYVFPVTPYLFSGRCLWNWEKISSDNFLKNLWTPHKNGFTGSFFYRSCWRCSY